MLVGSQQFFLRVAFHMGSLCWLRRWPVKPTQVGVHLHTVGPPLLCPTMGETERSAHLNQATGPSSPIPSCSRSPEGRGLLCGPPVPGGAPLLLVVAQASLLLGSQCTWLSCQHLTTDRWTEYPSTFMCGLLRITMTWRCFFETSSSKERTYSSI